MPRHDGCGRAVRMSSMLIYIIYIIYIINIIYIAAQHLYIDSCCHLMLPTTAPSRTGEELGQAALGLCRAWGTGRAGSTGSSLLTCWVHPAGVKKPQGGCTGLVGTRGFACLQHQGEGEPSPRGCSSAGDASGRRSDLSVEQQENKRTKRSAFLPRIFISVVPGENKCV